MGLKIHYLLRKGVGDKLKENIEKEISIIKEKLYDIKTELNQKIDSLERGHIHCKHCKLPIKRPGWVSFHTSEEWKLGVCTAVMYVSLVYSLMFLSVNSCLK